GMTINYEREVLDYIYADANKQPFVITTITNPLNINTTWSYVFTFYGKQTYGYVPSFWGDNQEGFLGDLPMQQDLNEPPLRYMIIEPEAGIQKHWVDEYTRREDLLSDVIEEKKIGNFTIQKRLFHPDKGK
ncbi:MAG TPA: hypothetical protein VLF20_00215, partial [Patescibacteria group bacterium]|nr:hypothetical protein [Patescibacteria group bacterium]